MSDFNHSALAAELERDEGVRYSPYRDREGKLTIGVGRNLDDRGLTPVEVRFLLTNDILVAAEGLDWAIPGWRTKFTERRKRVLLNMCFNLGQYRLAGFKKMIAALERGDYKAAADEMLDSKWAGQVGKRAERLAAIMREG